MNISSDYENISAVLTQLLQKYICQLVSPSQNKYENNDERTNLTMRFHAQLLLGCMQGKTTVP